MLKTLFKTLAILFSINTCLLAGVNNPLSSGTGVTLGGTFYGNVTLSTNTIVFGADTITNAVLYSASFTNFVTSGQVLTMVPPVAGSWTYVTYWGWFPTPGGGSPQSGISTNGNVFYLATGTAGVKSQAIGLVLPLGAAFVVTNQFTGTQSSNVWVSAVYIPTQSVSWVQAFYQTNVVDLATNLVWTVPYNCIALQSGPDTALNNVGPSSGGKGAMWLTKSHAASQTLAMWLVPSGLSLPSPPNLAFEINSVAISPASGIGYPLLMKGDQIYLASTLVSVSNLFYSIVRPVSPP